MRTHLYDRIGEGEEIYFLLGEELDDALVVACSAGALEVAYPSAYLLGDTLTYVEPHRLVPREPMPKAGTVRFRRWTEAVPASGDPRVPLARSVLLVDDGLLPTPDLVAMASSLRNARPHRLTVAAPWLSAEALAALRCVAGRVPPPRRRPEPTWYEKPPDVHRSAGLLADVIGRDRRLGEAP